MHRYLAQNENPPLALNSNLIKIRGRSYINQYKNSPVLISHRSAHKGNVAILEYVNLLLNYDIKP
jgi:hypothetical protein